MNLGNRIVKLRKKNGISQEELAKHLNVTRQAVSNWERSKTEPDAEMIKSIAEFFDAEIDYLFYGDSKAKSENRRTLKMLLYVNLTLLLIHIVSVFFKLSYLMPVIITPILITFIIIIMHTVFVSSIKNGDYSIIAGYDIDKDDDIKVRKQLCFIELITLMIGILCNVLFFSFFL